MKTLKKLLNINLSSLELEKLYEVIDTDGDGVISISGDTYSPLPQTVCSVSDPYCSARRVS